jgi:Tol biopolymer transport system component
MMNKLTLLFCVISSALVIGCGGDPGPEDEDDEGGGSSFVEIEFKDSLSATEPRFSPDGATIAYVQSDLMGDSYDLAVMDAAGNDRKTLAPAGTYLAGPAWTPDGQQIFFTSDGGISMVAPGGGAVSVAVMDFAALDPDVSPDGKSIVYGINGGNLRLVDLANPSTPKDLGASGTSPRFSPDGLSIAFESGDMIKRMELASGMVTDIVDAGTYLASVDWFPDGGRLAITSDEGIEIVTLGATPERKVLRDEFASMNVDVSADGEKIAYSVNGSTNVFVLRGF